MYMASREWWSTRSCNTSTPGGEGGKGENKATLMVNLRREEVPDFLGHSTRVVLAQLRIDRQRQNLLGRPLRDREASLLEPQVGIGGLKMERGGGMNCGSESGRLPVGAG